MPLSSARARDSCSCNAPFDEDQLAARSPHVLQGFNRGRIDAPVAGECAIVVGCESNKEHGVSRRLRVRGFGLLNANFIQMPFQGRGIEALPAGAA